VLIGELFEGPIDVVGDVHGEIRALEALLKALGYRQNGEHPGGRRLVFVGDLIDRGEDSPAVAERVMTLIQRGHAQCVLGNHELNLLRRAAKAGNGWLIKSERPEQQPGGEFAHSRIAPPGFLEPFLTFLHSLPVALEREDIRIVHAAWVSGEIDVLRPEQGSALEIFDRYERSTQSQLETEGIEARARREKERWRSALHDRHHPMELLTAIGERDERLQMGNPVRVVTSGVERLAAKTFWASGQWRMVDRVRWWEEYWDTPAVVMGHYWRRLKPIGHSDHASTNPDLFHGVDPLAWMGARQNVFCVDYSVGARYEERKKERQTFDTRLAALRWPEREVWGEAGPLEVP
jgi:hypothetical protein